MPREKNNTLIVEMLLYTGDHLETTEYTIPSPVGEDRRYTSLTYFKAKDEGIIVRLTYRNREKNEPLPYLLLSKE